MNMMNMMNMQNMIHPSMNMPNMNIPSLGMQMSMPSMGLFSETPINHFLMNINEYIKFLQDYILASLEKENRQQQDLNDLRSNINKYIMNIEMNFGINMGMIGQTTIPNNINKIKNDITQFFCQLNSFNKVKEDYFEADKIKIENDTITSKIFEKVSGLSKGKESIIKDLEIEGNFLFSIGKIARESLKISNKIYYELFQIFKKKEKIILGQENNRKNYSIWMKKYLQENGNSLFKIEAKKNEAIIKCMNSKYETFFIELFPDLIKLYLECALSIPLIEVSFEVDKYNKFDNRIMTDLFLKGKPTKINFCYLPELKSNGSQIPGGKFYVFTYLEDKTYIEKRDLENVKQNIKLNYL